MDNNQAMVEILMATYNGGLYIREQIDSIIGQTYSNWKLTIKDDCSTDDTYQVLMEYQLKFPEKIKVYQSEVPTGSAKNNFFELLELASEEYIMCCDQDDIWFSDKIEDTIKVLLEKENDKNEPILVYTDLAVINQEGSIIVKSYAKYSKLDCSRNALNYLLAENVVTGCTTLFNRALLEKCLEIKLISKVRMHDYWMAFVASGLGQIIYMNEPTILYRQHDRNAVGAKKANSMKRIINMMFKKTEMQEAMIQTMQQAVEFLNCYQAELSLADVKMLQEYILVKEKNKCTRICIILKNQILKNYFIKRIAMILWI